MNSSFSLYGKTDKSWAEKPYKEVLKEKIKLAHKQVSFLLPLLDKALILDEKQKEVFIEKYGYSPYSFIDSWLSEVLDSIKFNSNLLNELENIPIAKEDENLKKEFLDDFNRI